MKVYKVCLIFADLVHLNRNLPLNLFWQLPATAERRPERGLATRGTQSGRDPTTASYRAAMTMMVLGGIEVSRRLTEPPEGLAFCEQGGQQWRLQTKKPCQALLTGLV